MLRPGRGGGPAFPELQLQGQQVFVRVPHRTRPRLVGIADEGTHLVNCGLAKMADVPSGRRNVQVQVAQGNRPVSAEEGFLSGPEAFDSVCRHQDMVFVVPASELRL